jgi:hypothetical protein
VEIASQLSGSTEVSIAIAGWAAGLPTRFSGGLVGVSTPPTGATRPTHFAVGPSNGLIDATGPLGAGSAEEGAGGFQGRCEVAETRSGSAGRSRDTGVFRHTRPSRARGAGFEPATACALTTSGTAGARPADPGP